MKFVDIAIRAIVTFWIALYAVLCLMFIASGVMTNYNF